MKKKILALFLTLIFALAPSVFAVDVYINGAKLKTDTEPVIVQDWTMVPVRPIFQAFGASVQWDDINRSVLIRKDRLTILIVIGDDVALVNGAYKQMEVPAQLINNRTMVPVRFAVEALGGGVAWDGGTRSVIISSTPNAATPAPTPTPKPTPSPSPAPAPDIPAKSEGMYVGSIQSDKYHKPHCQYVDTILKENEIWFATLEDAIAAGYIACKKCGS